MFPIPVAGKAFIVGCLGSLAYFTALYLGFLGENRESILKFFRSEKNNSVSYWQKALWFILIGGMVAFVFQLAQLQTFVPIQAFVLGVSWPSVVGQYLQGKGRPSELENLLGGG